MERRKKLATAGAVSLTATAAVIALGASVGLFGLTDDSARIGKLSPIDSTQSTTSTTPTVPSTANTTVTTAPSVRGDGADDRPNHDVGDDHGVDAVTTPSTTTVTQPRIDDHGDDSNRGPGSSGSGDDNSGPGSSGSGSGSSGSGRDHPEDD